MKKYFLTTALMGTFIAPAFGADKIITSANTCTVDVLGVSDNNATANTIATWTLKNYECGAGQYLNITDNAVECTECPTGSYCPGGTYTVESDNKGTNACPTGYASSDAGASSDTQCYTACTVDMVAKATAVSGNDYFGTGIDTCEPTACVAGWHVKPGLNLTETIGATGAGTNSAYINNTGSFSEINYDGKGSKGQEYYGISGNNAFAVDYGERGMLTGHGRCSTQAGVGIWDGVSSPEDVTVVNTLTDETGAEGARYCYCQVDGFTPTGGDKVMVTSAPWVFYYVDGSAGYCTYNCAYSCASGLLNDDVTARAFRAAVFNAVGSIGPATCVANTINIDWNPDNNGAHTINQCTYEGAIEVPADPVKPGYTFTGWKLLENTTTE